ncbi:hypothetical protein LQG66_32230 [Bradyrhizobium ontarionense]|uniref:Uncharacterized protein n=1 Tax=Bradyrhizobium ontarionense TaxID=2898149 RepID=A0ABY3R8Y6_9BRAD|nr:hypothetical protein [Bradyrhizobium sp. A19]UFZ03820.1 hypothetical protein LQG66_32230 [Bradyrhizobium sp. A19]
MTAKMIACATVLITCSITAARAEGECAKITIIEDRLACIEKKADAVPSMVGSALSGVKIEQAARSGICLYFNDRGQPALSISDCSHSSEQTFNIHK